MRKNRSSKSRLRQGKKLVEVQNIAEGNFLGFVPKDWTPPTSEPELSERLKIAEETVATLRKADLDNKEMINGLGEMLMLMMTE